MEQRIEKHRNSLQSKLKAGQAKFTSSLKQANLGAKVTAGRTMSAYKKSQKAMGTGKSDKQIENTFKAGKRAFIDFANHIKKRSPDLAISLFGKENDPEKIFENFDVTKMQEVFISGSKEQRTELLRTARLEKENAERRKRNGIEEIEILRRKTKWLVQTGQLEGDTAKEIIDQLDAEKQGFIDNTNSARDFHTMVNGMAEARADAEAEHNRELQEYLKEEKRLRDIVKDAVNGESAAIKLLQQGAEQAAKQALQLAQALKDNFSNALRESISALTAMFYKLQQNTQELIEFEKELMNANSVFNVTRKELFETSNQIVQFGQSFGLEMQNGAEGLYQLASAGLTADQAAKVLPETLKLSMAVQGDHNTIAKLTTQTLMGFSMEMEQAAEVTDKFAHVIQKSLIEYEDLTSAVKFAMPFFTATGQSVDQLLGALTVLTNRALEAGIAGRGLRQALAEFAEHADNNEAAFARMGLEIKKADGSMKDLTVIAKEYSDIIGPDAASNTELLTSLIDDLNVRGATAFVHLVQNADEFAEAVHNVENAGGELDEMVRIQNESMQSQIQILKNNIDMIFFYSDGVDRANGAMNEFHSAIIDGITGFQDLLVEGEEGNKQLTEFGMTVRDVAVEAVQALTVLLQDGVKFLAEFSGEGKQAIGILKAYMLPVQMLMKAIDFMGPRVTSLVVQFIMLNKIFSITNGISSLISLYTTYTMRTIAQTAAINSETAALNANTGAKVRNAGATAGGGGGFLASAGASMSGMAASVGGFLGIGVKRKKGGGRDMRTAQNKKAMKQWKKLGDVMKKMMRPVMQIARFFTTAAGAAVALAAAVLALGAYGISLMGTFQPIVDIFKGWGEAVMNLGKWLIDGLQWGLTLVVLKILQFAQTFGIVNVVMADVVLTTKTAMAEFGWAIQQVLMRVSMFFGGTFGYVVWGLDQMFKSIYEGLTGESSWPKQIWDSLFDNETGYLRWFTLGWWQNAFTDLETWFAGLTFPSVDMTQALTMPDWLLDIYDSGVNWLTGAFDEFIISWNNLKTALGSGINLAAIMGIEAFKTSWNAIATAMNSFSHTISLPEINISAPDWLGGMGFRWAGYNETISFGNWPIFGSQGGGARSTGGGQSGSSVITSAAQMGSQAQTAYQAGGHAAQQGTIDSVAANRRQKDYTDYDTQGLANGGYVKAMANGGFAKRGSYLVGERGPELFQPSNSGQIINNSRTGSILRNQLNNSRLGAGMSGAATMMVDTLVANESKMGKSKISVDTFAGVV